MLRQVKTTLLQLFTTLRRIAAILSTMVFRTQTRRWRKVANSGPPPWDERNRLIAQYIPNDCSVIDVGSGAQTLKDYLGNEVEYQPCDCVKSSPDVILIDFNTDAPLQLKKQFDYVVCSGVLEYIENPRAFLIQVTGFGRETLLSYNPINPGDGKLRRMANNWINHLSQSELESLFSDCELEISLAHTADNGELLYQLRQAKI